MKRIRLVFAAAAAMATMTMAAGPASAQVPLPPPVDLGPPQCEHGQLRAAENAAEHLNAKQVAKHTAKAAACLAGIPPGHAGQLPVGV